jgi:glycosyltransferase involved in cell wall biosynthesis
MRILSVSLDRRVLDPNTAVGQRQADYYRDHEVVYIVLQDPQHSKLGILFSAWMQARQAKGFDLVTAQDPFFCGWIGRIAARRMKIPLHLQDHSGAFARAAFGWKERLLRPMARSIVLRAKRIRTVSQRGKRGLMALGAEESKIDVIPVATDVSRFVSITRSYALPNQILCVARLEAEKGIDVLLHAMQIVHAKRADASLVIVGDGSKRRGLERLAASLGLRDVVLFAGSTTDTRPYLERAGVYAQPSHFEGWGMTVIEAAAAGLPIAMTDVGCAGEVIEHEKSGLVVAPGKAQELADALLKLLSDPVMAKQLAEAARARVMTLPNQDSTTQNIRASFDAAIV